MGLYIVTREFKVIDGKTYCHEEEGDCLFYNHFDGLASIFDDFTDAEGEQGTIELSYEKWCELEPTIEKDFPDWLDEINMIRKYWDDFPDEDYLVCRVI